MLTLIRQRALRRMVTDFKLYLNQIKLTEDFTPKEIDERKRAIDKEIEKLLVEFETKTLDSEYLLNKIKDFRKNE